MSFKMSGENVYPTIDSMSINDIIKYLHEKINCKVTITELCNCKYPIKSGYSEERQKICMKCGKHFKSNEMNQKQLEKFRDEMFSFGETS